MKKCQSNDNKSQFMLVLWFVMIINLTMIRDVSCLAAADRSSIVPNNNNNNNSKQQPPSLHYSNRPKSVIRVISTKKSGGHSKSFSFFEKDSDDDDDGTNNNNDDGRIVTPKKPNVILEKWWNNTMKRKNTMIRRFQSFLRSTFLPLGYPSRTPRGYLQYSLWSWIQDFCTQLRSVVATQRVLEGVGVGQTEATALSAVMNFIVRDGCGMAATLLFTSAASSRFRTDIKRWRLLADIMVDIGITFEMASNLVPTRLFLPIICFGTMCKAVCGVAAGACNGAINLYWATGGSDISDINAKFGAQNTVTGSLGLLFGAVFAKKVSTLDVKMLWIVSLFLTFLHIFANIQCMRLVSFHSLNNSRMNMILTEFIPWWEQQQQQQQQKQQSSSSSDINDDNVATTNNDDNNDNKGNYSHNSSNNNNNVAELSNPSQISKAEPLFLRISKGSSSQRRLVSPSIPIYFGESFNDFITRTTATGSLSATSSNNNKSVAVLQKILNHQEQNNPGSVEKYIISVGYTTTQQRRRRRRPCVNVAIRNTATPVDEAKAYVHAIWLGRKLGEDILQSSSSLSSLEEEDEYQSKKMAAVIEERTQAEMETVWPVFRHSCENSGWDLQKTELWTQGYEYAIELD